MHLVAGPAPSSSSINKSSTLPLNHRLSVDRSSGGRERERDGYYSDRNELLREREKERERERGYLSDHNTGWVISFFLSTISGHDDCWILVTTPDALLVSANRVGRNGLGIQMGGDLVVRLIVPPKGFLKVATKDPLGILCHLFDKIAVWMTAVIKVDELTLLSRGNYVSFNFFCQLNFLFF